MEPQLIKDTHDDSCVISVMHDKELCSDLNVSGYNGDLFVLSSSDGDVDMIYTPAQARKLAAALILAADECEK